MKKIFLFLLQLCIVFIGWSQVSKMPAYPLITHDPYFSIWSFSDEANVSTTRHWTGKEHSIEIKATVDGKEFFGDDVTAAPEEESAPESLHDLLNAQAGKRITFLHQPQGQRRHWLAMAEGNAMD